MQETLIGKFIAHYRLPAPALDERRRLDQVMRTALDGSLERALERAGAPEDGELCIRRIHAPVRLRLSSTDAAMADEWSSALAEEIARALRDGRAIFYRSRRQALMDMAMSMARGDLNRAWAWRQLGLWRASDRAGESEAIFELTRALCSEPAAIVPAMVVLAEAGWMGRTARRMTGEQWTSLAIAALAEIGVARLLDEFERAAALAQRAPSPRAVREALRVLNNSRLLRVVIASQVLTGQSAEACRAVAALAAFEAEPALLRTASAPALIAIVAETIRASRSNIIEALPDSSAPDDAVEITVKADETAIEDRGERVAGVSEEESAPPDLRRRALTKFGGLLFLLGVIEELKLVDEILASDALGLRPLRWTMSSLALAIVPARIDDPAALAFAGLPPGAEPPHAVAEPMTEAEAIAIQTLAARIVERLRASLEWPDEPAATLIEFVCHRRAEVVAEPGWIDVKLSLDEVSTEIRRAGLDLDPGYVPWLGVVMKFVYE
jgi:hypothetical protein